LDLKETIITLSNAAGIPGGELPASQIALEYLKAYTSDCHIKNGNVTGHFGKREDGKPHVLLDAHMDTVGFVVTYLTEDGFLEIESCGAVDRRLLCAQPMIVLGKERLPGVICSTPPHLADGENPPSNHEKVYVDIGMSKAEAEKYVSAGDGVTFDVKAAALSGDRLTGAGLADRCGVAALLRTLELIKGEKLGCSYSVLFSAQEEVGERGAKTAVFSVNPHIAVVVDATFARTPDDSEAKYGLLGKGPMVGVSPVLDGAFSKRIMKIAEEKNIPCQVEVMAEKTGTDADMISLNGRGVKTALLSIPLRYMHSPVEVISLSDVENTARLTAGFMAELPAVAKGWAF
jgi:endoglucanase